MLSDAMETLLSKLMVTLSRGERNVEKYRKILANTKDFDADQIFLRLDKEKRNFINEYNVVEFLKQNKIYSTAPEARLILLFYDSDFDGNLNKNEFLNMILSDQNVNMRSDSKRRIAYMRGYSISNELESAFCQIIQKELDLAREIEEIFSGIKNKNNLNMLDAFDLIQGDGNYISEAKLRRFMLKNEIDFTDDDLIAAFKRLDINRDSKVTFIEFRKLFTAAMGDSNNINYENLNNVLKSSKNIYSLMKLNTPKKTFINNSNNPSILQSRMSASAIKLKKTNSFKFENKSSCNEDKKSILDKSLEILNKSFMRKSEIKENSSKEENIKQLESLVNNQKPYNFSYSKNFYKSDSKVNDNSNFQSNFINKTNHSFYISQDFKKSQSTQFYYESQVNQIIDYEEEHFNYYLRDLLELEKEIESTKIDLILKEDFNIQDAFSIFELSSRGMLTQSDIKHGLNSLDIYPTFEQIDLLIKRYDKTKEEKIYFKDFFDMLCPIDEECRSILEARLTNKLTLKRSKSDVFMSETSACFKDLLRVFINVECRIESLRQRLNKMPKFQIKKLYKKFDQINKGYINEIDVNKFLKLINYLRKHNIKYLDEDIRFLFLRYDFNRDSKIQFNEFHEELYPKSRVEFI